MTKCLRKIAKVVSKRIGPAPAAVEHCVDEIFTTMPAVVDTYRCKLMRSFIIKSRLQLAGFEFEHSDLEKIKRLRDLREQIFNPENRKVPTSFLGVHFSTLQALEVTYTHTCSSAYSHSVNTRSRTLTHSHTFTGS